ncbi:MAG: SOS response-associated peptidase [Nannocystaceae bacterium]|nr:SOS response-associated peptidase [Myxococcales bacterium]
MCGRFTLTTRYDDLTRALGLDVDPLVEAHYRPRYNIAPTTDHWILAREGGREQLLPARWGFQSPFGAGKDDPVGHINARAETAADKPTFRGAFLHGRCGVVADGFFEWTGPKGQKRPVWFHRRDHAPMVFAGLCQDGDDQGRPRRFTILTCAANQIVTPFHNRMPVILPMSDLRGWLEPQAPQGRGERERADREAMRATLSALMIPAPDDLLVATPVSTRVNSIRYDDPGCVAPIDPEDE